MPPGAGISYVNSTFELTEPPRPEPELEAEAGPPDTDGSADDAPVSAAAQPVGEDQGCGCRTAGSGAARTVAVRALLALALVGTARKTMARIPPDMSP